MWCVEECTECQCDAQGLDYFCTKLQLVREDFSELP